MTTATQITIPANAIIVPVTVKRNKARVSSRNKGKDCNACGTSCLAYNIIRKADGEYILNETGLAFRICNDCL